jgi:hypothetical protein
MKGHLYILTRNGEKKGGSRRKTFHQSQLLYCHVDASSIGRSRQDTSNNVVEGSI